VYYREDVFIESYNITQITDISSLASFPVHILSKPAPERLHQITSQDFNETRVAVVSVGPYANHLHLAPDR